MKYLKSSESFWIFLGKAFEVWIMLAENRVKSIVFGGKTSS
jgi:hypothetical protein